MAFSQGGATDQFGRFFPTKKALKDAVAADPAKVSFYSTSPMGPQFHATLDTLPEHDGLKLSVVGPDPERSRKWYATVEVKGGQVKVS